MSWKFDYERFWRDAVRPDWLALPPVIRDTVKEIAVRCKDQRQNEALGMDWPEDWPALREALTVLPKDILGRSMHIVHDYGHCMPGDEHEDKWIQATGAYWKYRYFAENAWRELYPGEQYPTTYPESFRKPKYYTHEEGTPYSLEELTELWRPRITTPCKVCRVEACNFTPHPFMIGPAHMKSDSMYLDPRSAPCAYRGCKLPYDEHVHDTVLFLELTENCKMAQLNALLKPLADQLKADKIDGVAFVGNEFDIIDANVQKAKHE